MSLFSASTNLRLARSVLLKDRPVYVQYYLTARCNLACEQCQVIHANADLDEMTIEQVERIADNLGKIGVSIVLLTGGEPFVRRDIVEIVRAFSRNNIHVRLQTNGLATRRKLEECVSAGARDISISLDTLDDDLQDSINGGSPGSFRRAVAGIATVSQVLPAHSFAAIGCVLMPRNILHVPDVIRFATEIGWWVSLVPVHTTSRDRPRSFRSFDPLLEFTREVLPTVDRTLDRILRMKEEGFNVYDSTAYLEDVRRFIRREPVTWRDRKGGVCDSPNFYFAILPNGRMAVCCDHRLPSVVPVYAENFPEVFRSEHIQQEIRSITTSCEGCMFGSFPEITLTLRHFKPLIQRGLLFSMPGKGGTIKRIEESDLMTLIARLRAQSDFHRLS